MDWDSLAGPDSRRESYSNFSVENNFPVESLGQFNFFPFQKLSKFVCIKSLHHCSSYLGAFGIVSRARRF